MLTDYATWRPQECIFLALSFVVAMVVVFTSHNALAAILIIGLLVALFLNIGTHSAWPPREHGAWPPREHGAWPPREHSAWPPREHSAWPPRPGPPTVAPRRYRGAIDIDEYDTEPGHRDRDSYENDRAPYGNPFNLNRVGAPHAAGPCLDDEANDDELDGDERINYQALSRNDHSRATTGSIGRKTSLDPYLREEVTEEEGREWWGHHEV